MITVIKRGKPKKEKPIACSCPDCKSVIKFLPTDAKRIPDMRDGDYYELGCPVCGETIRKAI